MSKHFLIFLVGIVLSWFTYAQKFEGTQFCPIGFTLLTGKEFKARMEPAYSKLPGKEVQNGDKLEYTLTYSLYELITRQLMENLKVYIPPPNVFENKVKYDTYGFPIVTIQKAIKLSDAKYFFKCQVRIEEAYPGVTPQGMVTPGITLLFTLYSKQGYVPIKNISISKVMQQAVKADISLLAGLTSQQLETNGPTIETLMRECISELCNQLEQ